MFSFTYLGKAWLMKLIKFNSVKLAILVTIIYAIAKVMLLNSLSYLFVHNVGDLLRRGIIVIALYVFSAFAMSLNERCKAVSSYYVKRQLNCRIDNYYEKILFTDFHTKTVGERANIYVNNVSRVVNLTLNRLISIVFNISLIVFILFSLYRIHWAMCVIGLTLALILWLVQKGFERKLSEYIIFSQNESENFLKKITEILLGYTDFVENSAFSKFKTKSEKASERYANSISKTDIYAGNISSVLTFISNLFTVIAIICLSYLVITKGISAGFLLAVIGLMPMLGDALETVISEKSFYKSGKDLYNEKFNNIEETYDERFTKPFIKRNADITSKNISESNGRNIEKIEIHNLSVMYDDRVIKYKNILLEAGKKYAIVGKSGAGKTTLLKTILGELNDYSGEILINGVAKDKDEVLFNDIAYVRQDVFLFNESLEDNIKLSNDSADVDKLLNKVDFLELSPEQELSENGKNLSGGQRKRISFARALARNKKVIFLDEVTAGLDAKASQYIENMILEDDALVVMISHNLTEETKSKLDYIIDLSDVNEHIL